MLIANRFSCRNFRSFVACGSIMALSIAGLTLAKQAHAQFTGTVSGTGQFESNSNVFALQSGAAAPQADDSRHSDTYYSYGAQVNGAYSLSRQQIFASFSATDFNYQHFTELNHTEYSTDLGLRWKVGELLSGTLEVDRGHTMVPTYDLVGSQQALSVMTTQTETAQVGLKVNSYWKVQGSFNASKTDQPLNSAPDLELTQYTGTLLINYLGMGPLTTGLSMSYSPGNYDGANGNLNATINPSFDQETVALTANYVHNRTQFEGQIGYSRRTSDAGTDSTSGLTGSIGLTRQLTPKTSFSVNLSRAISSYFLNASSEIDSIAGATVNWQATYKLSVSGGYTFTYREYPSQGNDPVGSDRIDRQQYGNLAATYQPRKWLSIRPYANLQARRSNFNGGDYNSTAIGVAVTITPYRLPR